MEHAQNRETTISSQFTISYERYKLIIFLCLDRFVLHAHLATTTRALSFAIGLTYFHKFEFLILGFHLISRPCM